MVIRNQIDTLYRLDMHTHTLYIPDRQTHPVHTWQADTPCTYLTGRHTLYISNTQTHTIDTPCT